MGSFSFPKMYLVIWASILGAQLVSGQSVSPTNSTSAGNISNQFTLDTTLSSMGTHADLEPLTDQAGQKGSLSQLQVSGCDQSEQCSPSLLTDHVADNYPRSLGVDRYHDCQ